MPKPRAASKPSQREIYEHVQSLKRQGKTRDRNGRRFRIVTIYGGYDARRLAAHDARRFRAIGMSKTILVKTKWGWELWLSE